MTWGLGALPGLSGGTACGDPFEGAVGMAGVEESPGDIHKLPDLPGAQMEASPESKDERPSPWLKWGRRRRDEAHCTCRRAHVHGRAYMQNILLH